MKPEDKRYVLENMQNRSAKKMADELGLKERKVQKFLDKQRSLERLAKKQEKAPAKTATVLLSCALIIVLGIAAYATSLQGQFLWDDEYHVVNNAYIRSAANLANIFTQDLGAGSGRAFGFYRPIQALTCLIDYHFWKLDPFGYHLTNMLLHILAGLALYLFVRTLCAGNNFIALATSALYLVHPVHTGAIAYISGRADPLAASFLLIAFTFYIKNLENKSVSSHVVFSIGYVLALMSKEYALILPFLLLFYHYSLKKKIRPAPMVTIGVITLAYIFLRTTVLWQVHRIDSGIHSATTILQRLPGFFAALTSYARLILLPINLHVEYGKKLFGPFDPMVILGVLILCGLIWLARKKADDTMMVFGLGWFLITILPMSNIYPLNAYMAEHWLYFPSIGIFLIVAKEADALRRHGGISKIVVTGAVALLATVWLGMTAQQNFYWAEPVGFFKRTLTYEPWSVKMHNDIGRIYAMTGMDNEKAEEAFKKAIEVEPQYPLSYNNMGFLYNGMGRKDEAVALYKKALERDPYYTDALVNLANAYVEKGMYDDGIRMYKKAIQTHPNSELAYSNLGAAYLAVGRNADAEYAFTAAIRLNPRFADAYFNLAILCARTGRTQDARALYNKAVELKPKLTSSGFLEGLEKSGSGK